MALHDLLAPDGYLLGWNQGGALHPHMHVIPRFDDEPLSDRWLRSAINVPENRRPDPWAPGSGRALRGARVSHAGSHPIEQATLDSGRAGELRRYVTPR
jgi:diadenosine tetraphosphate (Ap4A) HIT family hydrolase